VKYDEEQLSEKEFLSFSFYLYRFRKYLSYGFPIINFCNPGVLYETPCISPYVSEKGEGKVKVKLFLYVRGQALKGFRKLRLPEFQ
jgi:hypothetical protein